MWDGGPTLVPDAVSYNTAIKACANAFQVGKALEVSRKMVRRCVCWGKGEGDPARIAAPHAGRSKAWL